MKHCLDCATKHLEQAMIVHEEEVLLGYPEHIHRVRGHLAEAARETVSEYAEFAQCLRAHRLRTLDEEAHIPPYMELLAYVDLLVACDMNTLPAPELPEHLAPGAEKPAETPA